MKKKSGSHSWHVNTIVLMCLFLLTGAAGFSRVEKSPVQIKDVIPKDSIKTIDAKMLRNKIAGGWAGKMIGVTYGAPIEFKAQGAIYTDAINWKPEDVKGALWQDDLYVQLTFMMTMDRFGISASEKKFQELFATAGYELWHANVQARKNYFDKIYPPYSGSPKYNIHADDIDFQIEADFLGFMCPGMPNTFSKMASRIGHIMNYGDGVYGGIFLSALYTHAFFENDIQKIIQQALRSIPSQSAYAKIINDVIILHQHYPENWQAAWRELYNKWGKDNICEAGSSFNIDANLNGAFVILGLLYGGGDIDKTMEITTRCGQDADCNPSNAVAVLGVIQGFTALPSAYQEAVKHISDSLFIHTNYSFNKAVNNTMEYAKSIILKNGGKIHGNSIVIKQQEPVSLPLEVSFPKTVFAKRTDVLQNQDWDIQGDWQNIDAEKTAGIPCKYSDEPGAAISVTFNGTGVAIIGNWVRDAGKAAIYVDGKYDRDIDCFFYYAGQEHRNISIYHIMDLPPGDHSVMLVVKADKNPASVGKRIYVSYANIYKASLKPSEVHKFSFQQ